MLGLLVVIIASTIMTTVAYLYKKNEIKENFTLGTVTPEVIENFNIVTKTKSNVAVKNVGNVPVYIRAIIVTNWKDSNGNIVGDAPIKDTDYTMELSNSTNWIKGADGYYYYKLPVQPGKSTEILIDTLKQIVEHENQDLVVDIIAQSIQAEPDKAVIESWDVEVTDGIISLKDEESI